jgi:hypothetical protein
MNPDKTWGITAYPPVSRISSRDSTTRIEQILPTRQGLQKRKTYSRTLLGTENSDRAKDTWCYPHCLNAVHEKAGDECVHEKLKEVRFRQ